MLPEDLRHLRHLPVFYCNHSLQVQELLCMRHLHSSPGDSRSRCLWVGSQEMTSLRVGWERSWLQIYEHVTKSAIAILSTCDLRGRFSANLLAR